MFGNSFLETCPLLDIFVLLQKINKNIMITRYIEKLTYIRLVNMVAMPCECHPSFCASEIYRYIKLFIYLMMPV